MSNLEIGIRKNVEAKKLQYWLRITANPIYVNEDATSAKIKFSKKSSLAGSVDFINSSEWKIFIIFTIMINILISVNYFCHDIRTYFVEFVIAAHMTCMFYWVDFLVAVAEKIIFRAKVTSFKTRKIIFLVVDAISLLPLSEIYLITVREPNAIQFWWSRSVTLLRFYRIPLFFSKMATAGQNPWKAFAIAYILYLILFIDILANLFISWADGVDIDIKNWNKSIENEFIAAIYFSSITMLNVGYGDIVPTSYVGMIECSLAMAIGCSIITGVLTGTLATEFANKEKKREVYRHEYEATMNTIKERKIDKKVLEKTSENLQAIWKYKKGYMGPPPVHILPLSLQKEIYFDVNFGLLNRSLIFSMQPRSFLRSVSLLMKNVSFLSGDVIMEPFSMADAMLCVASGVIEIISEENDETTLFSLTAGSILGEATLFISIPIRCIIRASTYVELQVLMKDNFSRMALKYPEIYRSMRAEIFRRLEFYDHLELDDTIKTLDSDFYALSKRKALKRFIEEMRRHKKDMMARTSSENAYKSKILKLYVLAENIPRVKTLPINLIKARPWILRPNTTLMELWNLFIVLVVCIVVFVYPYLAGFVRKINSATNVYLFVTEVIYVIDIYIQCTTAIERKDHFTYITSVKEIVRHKLKTVSFYLDVLAAYDLSIYAELVWAKYSDYAYLLLSQNRILKIWCIPRYFTKLENNMSSNILFIRAIKYFFYFCVGVLWSAVVLYLEACPGEFCIEDRWYGKIEQIEVEDLDPTPCSEWPAIMSLYWACITMCGVGYGDISAKTISDCLAVIVCITAGTVLITICVAQASSTFKHIARMRTYYQEEVFAVDRYMKEHEISEDLQKQVRNFFRLQWNYDKGFSLKQATVTEGLLHQHRQIILTELMKTFLTVPLFQDASTDFLRVLAKHSKVQVLPPNEVITDAGSFTREMYILENGYCQVSTESNLPNREVRIIGPVNAFGFIEMILGIPLYISVQTLTHARIISLDYSSYLRAVTKYPTVKTEIDNKIERDYREKDRKSFEVLGFKTFEESATDEPTLQKQKTLLSKNIINVYRYQKSLSKNYWEPFKAWGKFQFLQFFLLPFVIVPYSIFIKIWMTVRIIVVLILGLIAPIHFSLPNHTKRLSTFILTLQGFSWVDMYLMFHVAYYDHQGILMFHPAKTATWYLKGNFVLDLFTVFPFYLVIRASFPRTENTPSLFYDGPGLIMVFQFYKFFQGCYYLENDILRRTENIKILKFVPMAVIVTNFVSGLLILLECYRYTSYKELTHESSIIANEFQQSIAAFCVPRSQNINHTENISVFKMYVTTYYWVTTTMTGCGFGDLSAHNKTTMIVVMIIIVLGIFLYGYMFANLTSSMISVHNQVTKYRRRIREMARFMKQKNVNHEIQMRLILHYQYSWQRTEGAKPQQMFSYVHAALREDIVASIYEATIRQVPAFVDVEKSVIRVIGKYLDEVYFLQGETIVKYNDVQECIYLIYRGEVDVLSKNGALITKMGTGGMFGNISNKPFSLSSVVVVAVKNVDMLRLDSGIFFKSLQVFSNTKSLVEFLMSSTTDYIEPLPGTNNRRSDFPALAPLDTIPYKATAIRAVKNSMHSSLIDFTADYENFYFKNSIFKFFNRPCYSFVILLDSPLHKAKEAIVFMLAYVSCTLTMYMFAFQDMSTIMLTLSYFLDIAFYINIGLRFHSSYYDKCGDLVINNKKIKKRYLQSKKLIGFDIAANIPLDLFALTAPQGWKLATLSILRLNRILRLCYIFEIYSFQFKALMVNKIYLEISYILVCISLMTHLFACFWFFVACPLGKCDSSSWVTAMSLPQNEKQNLYVVSVYYVITLITTTGYGDIPVYSTAAMLTSTFYMILSRFGIVLLAGAMAAVINVHSLNLFLFQDRIRELKETFLRQNMSEYQIDKMWHYVTSLWLHETGKQIPKFISTAPYVMRCEVMSSMFGSHLSHCYVFSQMDEAFLRQLAIYLKRFVYFAGNYIVQQGDIDHTMYFINKGKVSVLTIHPNLMETIHFTLEENDNFGMTQGLILGKAHHFSYRAETDVEILSLTLSQWQKLLKYFPSVGQKIYKRIESLPISDKTISQIQMLN